MFAEVWTFFIFTPVRRCSGSRCPGGARPLGLRRSHSNSKRTTPSVRRTDTRTSRSRTHSHRDIFKPAWPRWCWWWEVEDEGRRNPRNSAVRLVSPARGAAQSPLFIVTTRCAKLRSKANAACAKKRRREGGRGKSLKVGGSPSQVGGGQRRVVCCRDGGVEREGSISSFSLPFFFFCLPLCYLLLQRASSPSDGGL